MQGFVADIEKLTERNDHYRHVLYTGKHLQLVLMTLRPGEEIGEEIHQDRDQFFRVEQGKGKVLIDGKTQNIESGHAMLVPAGAQHNVINTDDDKLLKLYTLYGPPNHRDGVDFTTKKEAESSKESFNDVTTE